MFIERAKVHSIYSPEEVESLHLSADQTELPVALIRSLCLSHEALREECEKWKRQVWKDMVDLADCRRVIQGIK